MLWSVARPAASTSATMFKANAEIFRSDSRSSRRGWVSGASDRPVGSIETTVPAVKSLLFRARQTLRVKLASWL
jgi:hypothetical protein